MKADQAIKALVEGNKRFVDAKANDGELSTQIGEVNTKSQSPFAIILGCSDSRAPLELIFNCGVGDLFVVRVAGNIASASQIGSIEFACQHFNTELVVVLGHTHCGAVEATLNSLHSGAQNISNNIADIVNIITPAVSGVVNGSSDDRDHLLRQATHANVQQSVDNLSLNSSVIRELISNNKLKIIGAVYSIESGDVQFLD